MKYKICWCGNDQDNHRFKHNYEPIIFVKKKSKKIILNANNYPTKHLHRCEDCTAIEVIHDGFNVKHDYKRIDFDRREINFSIPQQHKCYQCDVVLSEHDSIFHPFTIRMKIYNHKPDDLITVIDKKNSFRKIRLILVR